MTRYSDLIAHFQGLIEKHGDQPFARSDGPWTCNFFLKQVTEQNRNLNKSVHRKNRLIERLRNDLKKVSGETSGVTFSVEPGDASVDTISAVFTALSELSIAKGGKGLEFTADGMTIMAKPIP